MQGGHSDQTKERLLIDLDPLIPPHHFLRRVQQVLDLSSIHQLSAPFYSAGKGRPSIDPEIIF